MVRDIVGSTGATGYRHQLDRARRFLDRVQRSYDDLEQIADVDFQDNMWSFFQHCWHIKDWVENDPQVPRRVMEAIIQAVYQSKTLIICQDLCNGTKHLHLKSPRAGAGARHMYVETNIAPEAGRYEIDTIVDDGSGNAISGKQLAVDCIEEWERILAAHGSTMVRAS